ncbi:hypothetical protein IAT38_006228 [Cryptococcus sp. DSM 104549]
MPWTAPAMTDTSQQTKKRRSERTTAMYEGRIVWARDFLKEAVSGPKAEEDCSFPGQDNFCKVKDLKGSLDNINAFTPFALLFLIRQQCEPEICEGPVKSHATAEGLINAFAYEFSTRHGRSGEWTVDGDGGPPDIESETTGMPTSSPELKAYLKNLKGRHPPVPRGHDVSMTPNDMKKCKRWLEDNIDKIHQEHGHLSHKGSWPRGLFKRLYGYELLLAYLPLSFYLMTKLDELRTLTFSSILGLDLPSPYSSARTVSTHHLLQLPWRKPDESDAAGGQEYGLYALPKEEEALDAKSALTRWLQFLDSSSGHHIDHFVLNRFPGTFVFPTCLVLGPDFSNPISKTKLDQLFKEANLIKYLLKDGADDQDTSITHSRCPIYPFKLDHVQGQLGAGNPPKTSSIHGDELLRRVEHSLNSHSAIVNQLTGLLGEKVQGLGRDMVTKQDLAIAKQEMVAMKEEMAWNIGLLHQGQAQILHSLGNITAHGVPTFTRPPPSYPPYIGLSTPGAYVPPPPSSFPASTFPAPAPGAVPYPTSHAPSGKRGSSSCGHQVQASSVPVTAATQACTSIKPVRRHGHCQTRSLTSPLAPSHIIQRSSANSISRDPPVASYSLSRSSTATSLCGRAVIIVIQ